MALDFLGRVGVTLPDSVHLTEEEIEFEQDELGMEQVEAANMRSEIDRASLALDNVISSIDVVTGLKANDVDDKLISAVFAQQLALSGVPEDVAEEASVGVESAGEEMGNEALQTVKDIVMDIVKWIVEKWKDLKALIKRTFAKHFGSVKRATDAWRKLKNRVEQFQTDGRVIDDKSKLEVKRGPAAFVLGKSGQENPKDAVAWSNLPKELEFFNKLTDSVNDYISNTKNTEFPNSLDEVGISPWSKVVSDIRAHYKKVGAEVINLGTGTVGIGKMLLGRQCFGVFEREGSISGAGGSASAEQMRNSTKRLNGTIVGIRPSHTKLKSIDEVKLDVPTLDQLDALADAHIDIGVKITQLEASQSLRKVEKAIDKAIESTKKWANDADKDNADEKRKAVAGANLGVAALNLRQDATLGVVGDLVRNYSSVTRSHGAAASMALGRYKAA